MFSTVNRGKVRDESAHRPLLEALLKNVRVVLGEYLYLQVKQAVYPHKNPRGFIKAAGVKP
jgi:hypothetical protein